MSCTVPYSGTQQARYLRRGFRSSNTRIICTTQICNYIDTLSSEETHKPVRGLHCTAATPVKVPALSQAYHLQCTQNELNGNGTQSRGNAPNTTIMDFSHRTITLPRVDGLFKRVMTLCSSTTNSSLNSGDNWNTGKKA